MNSTRVAGFLVSAGLLVGCGAKEVTPEPHQNPLYDSQGNSGDNPLFEGAHLAIDANGRPVIVYAGKVIEKATSGLKDTLKTQVRMIRPDTEGEGSAQPIASDASPRALGTVKDGVHLLISAADGSLSSLVLGAQTAPTPIVGFSAGEPGDLHRPVLSIGGTAFVALQGTSGEYDGQAVLVETNPATGSARVLPVSKPLGQSTTRFIADGNEANSEFVVAFETTGGVQTALTAGGRLTAAVDTGKTGKPLAVWTDGKLKKLVVDTGAGQLALITERGSAELAVSANPLCRAAAFSPDGKPYALEVTKTEVKVIDASGTAIATEAETFADGDFVDCALAFSDQAAHFTWRKLRSPPTESRIELDEIVYVQEPVGGSAALRLKTKHDTVKNSINNVR